MPWAVPAPFKNEVRRACAGDAPAENVKLNWKMLLHQMWENGNVNWNHMYWEAVKEVDT